MKIDDLPMHKDTYFFGYGIDIEKPTEMASQIIKLRKENQELEKQFEAAKEVAAMHLKNEIQFKAQQKEFIEWLERRLFLLRDEASELALGMCSTNYQDTKIEVYKEVLSKYKEIIGVKDE